MLAAGLELGPVSPHIIRTIAMTGQMHTTLTEMPAHPRKHVQKPLREIEVLRVAAQLGGDDYSKAAESARMAALKWTTKRATGRNLPSDAWKFQDFEAMAGGCNRAAVRIESNNIDIWALRVEDADTEVPRRVWCTEIVIARASNHQPQFSLRLVASTPEREFGVDPSVPNIVVQIIDTLGMYISEEALPAKPVLITTMDAALRLFDYLENPDRRIPVFVAVVPDEKDSLPHIDSETLAKATAGLACTVHLPEAMTRELTNRFGKPRSVFHGGVRVYMPGFSTTEDPFMHRLFLGDRLETDDKASACVRSLRFLAAAHSVTRTRFGKDVLDFATVRSESRTLRRRIYSNRKASDTKRLELADDEVKSLKNQLKQKSKEIDDFVEYVQATEERAEAAEREYRSLLFRNRQIQAALAQGEGIPTEDLQFPQNWSEFTNWVDKTYPDKIVLTSAARRLIRRAPAFEDVELVARCVNWLATFQQERRLEGGGTLANQQVEKGIVNAPCGGDTYNVDWNGRRYDVDRHIKSSGNKRDPIRCLRIYYFWESELELTVIDHLPEHRRTRIT